MAEQDGLVACATCGSCINRFIHQLVEFYVHPNIEPEPEPTPNALLRAALYGHTEVARAIWTKSPALRSARGANGESAAELALAAGHFGTAVGLFRAEALVLPEKRDPEALLGEVMSELSEAFACAGWLNDLEHYLWHLADGKETLPKSVDYAGFSSLPTTVREDLLWLSRLCGGWIRYGQCGPEFISAEAWSAEHQAWVASWPTQQCT